MLQINGIAPIDARYSYFGNHDPHDSLQVTGNFIIDPYLTSPVEFDTSNLVAVPSPVYFDTVLVSQPRTLNLRFFNVKNSLIDSLIIISITNQNPAFSLSQTAFTLPPIGEDTVAITFNPSEAGIYSDTLMIFTNEGEIKVELAGTAVDTSTIIVNNLNKLPLRFALHQNYPNPFNPSTTIEYSLPKQSRVVLKIYNMLGEEIRSLVNGVQTAGIYKVIWNGGDLRGVPAASGVYIYRLRASAPSEKAGTFAEQRKMVLIR
jgi:hypothetical protein